MNEDNPHHHRNEIRLGLMRETAVYAGIAAALMLFFGFERPFGFATGSPLYVNSVFATNWLLRIGGLALAATALSCWIGLQWSLFADAIVSALIGAALIVIGGIWITDSDMEGFLFLIFGAMFLNAARTSWNGSAVATAATPSALPAVDREAPITQPVDEAARQSARERLLQTKANLRRPETSRPGAETQDAPFPGFETSAEPTVSEVTKGTMAVSSNISPSPPATPALPPESVITPAPELPEDGFLAELGRANQNERK